MDTYDTLKSILVELGADFEEVKVSCEINSKSVDELYKVLRLWFEMDLKTYYEYEKDIKNLLSNGKIEYSNSIFIVKK